MIKVSFLFPNFEGAIFDDEYFFDDHFPMVARLLGNKLKGAEFDVGVLSTKAPIHEPEYKLIAHFLFESVDSFLEAFSLHAQKIYTNYDDFTNIEPQIQISEIIKYNTKSQRYEGDCIETAMG